MLTWIKSLFHDPTADWKRVVIDPVFGVLRLNDDATWWQGNILIGEQSVIFCIGGEGEPDVVLVAHAHEIVRDFDSFERTVSDHLANEAIQRSHWSYWADEINQLKIGNVNLFWPDRPNDGEIVFVGPDPYRIWTCSYIDRKPVSLVFSD